MSANATPKKPALVSHDHERKSNRHIVWDEHAISEHDELRGTRTKVSSTVILTQSDLYFFECTMPASFHR